MPDGDVGLLPCSKRCCYLGGSDIANLFSPYARAKLLSYKTHQSPPSFFGNNVTRMGTLLEPLVLDIYEEVTGHKIERRVYFQHADHAWMRGELDAFREGVVIDAKTTAQKTYDKSWKDGAIPSSIVYQQRWYAFLSGAQQMDVPVLLRDTGHFEIRSFERDPVEEQRIVDAALAFSEEVLRIRKELGDERAWT